MPQSLKVIKNRIKSVTNTRKVTSAMQMISVAKLNRVDKILYALRPYAVHLEGLLNNVVALVPTHRHPFMQERFPVTKRLLCVVTSDNGLCGTYNAAVLRTTEEFVRKYGSENTMFVVIGRRGYSFCKKKGIPVANVYLGLSGKYNIEVADKISRDLVSLFLEKKVDEIWCAHTHFENVIVQRPSLEKILPLEPKVVKPKQYILEPVAEMLLEKLALQSIIMQVRRIVAESFTAEHAARVVAMRTATDNAKELIDNLTILRNKVRQASITQEILEIVSSAEALKG